LEEHHPKYGRNGGRGVKNKTGWSQPAGLVFGKDYNFETESSDTTQTKHACTTLLLTLSADTNHQFT